MSVEPEQASEPEQPSELKPLSPKKQVAARVSSLAALLVAFFASLERWLMAPGCHDRTSCRSACRA